MFFRKGGGGEESLFTNVMITWLPLVSIVLSNHRNLAAVFSVYLIVYLRIFT